MTSVAPATAIARLGRVVTGCVTALWTAWRERRWPGPPSTWPGTIAHLWRDGVVRRPRAIRPTPMDRAAFEASFAAHYRPSSPDTRVALPPLTVVALSHAHTVLHDIVAALDATGGLWWELWLVPTANGPAVEGYAADARVRVLPSAAHDEPASVPGTAPFVLLLDGDTVPLSNGIAVALGVLTTGDADWVYTDDARRDQSGRLYDACLKGEFGPEQALDDDYATRLAIARRGALDAAGGLRLGEPRAPIHDLLLRVAATGGGIAHVDVLGAVRPNARPTPSGAASPSGTRPRRPLRAPAAAVTIVIPTRDRPDGLRTCIEALSRTVDRTRVSLVVVDDGSVQADTHALFDELRRGQRLPCEVIRLDDRDGFNYARLMNAGTAGVTTPLVLHLNDDVEATAPGWLDQMAGWMDRPEVGVVGAKLVYRDGSIQHAGVLLSTRLGGPDHLFRRLAGDDPGYQGLPHQLRNVSAVTGACLLTRTSLYRDLGGFDAMRFRVQFNDTDYCLRVRARGLRVVYEPAAVLVHDESASRGGRIDLAENRAFATAWGGSRDPYWSTRLDDESLCGPTPLVSVPPR